MTDQQSDLFVIKDLYQKPPKIYPRQAKGQFANLRVLSALALLGLYYVVPWLTWKGQQAILFDLPARQFKFFAITFWPQDFIFLTILLVICAIGLFLFTAVAGRVWCGYACPQTVWTETFLWIEEWVEGNRNKRIKLDKQPLNREKIIKKTSKHSLWLIFSFFTGYTFVGYFTPIGELWTGMVNLTLSGWEWFWIGLYSLATYGNAGKLKEQICLHMCPYARFQSAMFDKDTLIISYDPVRGENRGSRKKNADYKSQGLGDCIDCNQCVNVCPVGIDIRDGLQYECIACAACIDACDSVMAQMSYPKGLIKYTTEHAEHGQKTKLLRTRTLVYIALFASLILLFLYLIAARQPLDVNVIRDRNNLYTESFSGDIENIYQLKILNMSQQPHVYRLSVSGIDGLVMKGEAEISIDPGEVLTLPVRLSSQSSNLQQRSNTVYFKLENLDVTGEVHVTPAKFIGPEIK